MPCQVPPIQIGAASQPCTEREGLDALAKRIPPSPPPNLDPRLLYKGLVTNYGEAGGGGGGYKTGWGGHVKFYPYNRGGGKSFSHAEGGAHKVLG